MCSVHNEKLSQLVERVKAMPEADAEILEVFLAGFRAGRQITDREAEEKKPRPMGVRARNFDF